MISMGLTSLSWLMDNQVSSCGAFSPVGTAGVGPDTLGSVQFDQQPVEAWSSLSACLTASRFAHREKYVDRAHQCFAWFHGRNVVRARMASSITGSCFDGLHRTGVNNNQGAESTLSYLCSSLELSQAVESKESRFGIPVGKFSATVLS